MKNRYQNPRAIRRELNAPTGLIQAGMLQPMHATYVSGSESGSLSQTIHVELKPIAGRLITPVTSEAITVMVPVPAIDGLQNPLENLAGTSESFRQKREQGHTFGVELEGEISKACAINPASVSGSKNVSEIVRLGHNVAVNHLRKLKYVKATQLDASNTAITPALLSTTALERLNGVLDPEDRINGSVQFDLPNVQVPVRGVGRDSAVGAAGSLVPNKTVWESQHDGNPAANPGGNMSRTYDNSIDLWHGENPLFIQSDGQGIPRLYADFQGHSNNLSLQDFYISERIHDLTMMMRELVDKNPEHGEQLAARFALGMNVDLDNQPIVLYRHTKQFGKYVRNAMDGANLDVEQSDHSVTHDFVVPFPKTEFGAMIYTFVVVRPDEVLQSQPHPFLSEEIGAINYMADELKQDAVPVTVRQLHSDCPQGSEETVAMYTGNNGLKRTYMTYGFTRDTDENDVAVKNRLWQAEIPASITPENILYDVPLDIYPFNLNANGDPVASYSATSMLVCNTPIIFGPTQTEKLDVIDTENLFEDLPE